MVPHRWIPGPNTRWTISVVRNSLLYLWLSPLKITLRVLIHLGESRHRRQFRINKDVHYAAYLPTNIPENLDPNLRRESRHLG